MAELRTTERFFESIAQITSPRLQNQLENLVRLVEDVPTIGSTLNRGWLKGEFGSTCLTLEVKPFLFVYEYDESSDVVKLYGVVHQRQVK